MRGYVYILGGIIYGLWGVCLNFRRLCLNVKHGAKKDFFCFEKLAKYFIVPAIIFESLKIEIEVGL